MSSAMPALPPEFLARMARVLGRELDAFVAALGEPRSRGLRVNAVRASGEELAGLLGVELAPVPWSRLGRVVPEDAGLGARPAHHAGLYYLQDVSAMLPVEAMAPAPGWRVADVAAAPGGKTTHLLSKVGESGFVLANDVSRGRLGALHENLDRWGAPGVATGSARLDELAAGLPATFDAALLDAPCSGEGLFRREPEAILQWSPALVAGSARRQSHLLDRSAELVRPGGVLVYSTCTFEPDENEEVAAAFLARHPDWELRALDPPPGARPGLAIGGTPTERTLRVWPHDGAGDGQFVAVFDHDGTGGAAPRGRRETRRGNAGGAAEREAREQWRRFQDEACPGLALDPDHVHAHGPHVWYAPPGAPTPPRAARPGLPLGMIRPGRFQPAHGLAAVVDAARARDPLRWPAGDGRLERFLAGEEIVSPGPDGWVLVCYERWGAGWGRRRRGVLKNHLPHGLRITGRSPAR